VTDPATALSFFDPDRNLHGTLRSGTSLLFRGTTPTALPEGATFERNGEGLRAEMADRLSLVAEPLTPEADLGGTSARVCRVSGQVDGTAVDCLGTIGETHVAPSWDDLDAVRTLSVLVDGENALLLLARRPRGAAGHGAERIAAWLVDGGELKSVEDTRLSTVYDGEGRQRSASVELWMPGEELPRRGSGVVIAGSSVDLEAVRVQAAVFRWSFEGKDAIGGYELMVRSDPPDAA